MDDCIGGFRVCLGLRLKGLKVLLIFKKRV
jgi:hypothetical protein